MNKMTNLRGSAVAGRGLVAVRAEAQPTAPTSIEGLATAFEAFKSAHTEQLEEVKKGKADVVTAEKVDRINADLGEIQAALDKMNLAIAARDLGSADSGASTPEERQYRAAFNSFVLGDEDKEREIKAAHVGGIKASITRGTDTDGGYFAPVEWDRTIQKAMFEVSPIRQLATVTTTTKAGWKELYSDEAWGSGWVGETAARPNTATPTLDVYEYSVGEIYANPLASQTILDDAEIDIEQWIAEGVREKFNLQEGVAFLSGDGVNKPKGLLTYASGGGHPRGDVASVKTGSASGVTVDELITLIYKLPGRYRGDARFLMNVNTMAAIRKMKDSDGNLLWQPGLVAGQPSSILGYPITDVPDMPDIGAAAVPIVFGDIRAAYRVIDRIGIRVLRDPYSNKPYVQFYTTKRVGGGLKDPEAILYHTVAA